MAAMMTFRSRGGGAGERREVECAFARVHRRCACIGLRYVHACTYLNPRPHPIKRHTQTAPKSKAHAAHQAAVGVVVDRLQRDVARHRADQHLGVALENIHGVLPKVPLFNSDQDTRERARLEQHRQRRQQLADVARAGEHRVDLARVRLEARDVAQQERRLGAQHGGDVGAGVELPERDHAQRRRRRVQDDGQPVARRHRLEADLVAAGDHRLELLDAGQQGRLVGGSGRGGGRGGCAAAAAAASAAAASAALLAARRGREVLDEAALALGLPVGGRALLLLLLRRCCCCWHGKRRRQRRCSGAAAVIG